MCGLTLLHAYRAIAPEPPLHYSSMRVAIGNDRIHWQMAIPSANDTEAATRYHH